MIHITNTVVDKVLEAKLNKTQEVFEEWSSWNTKLYKACVNYIEVVLDALPEHKIEIDENYPVSVPYDGGNHPEYASNCFSDVYCVYYKNNNIYLDIEDCEEYSIENISAENAYDIVQSIRQTLEEKYETD